MPVTYTPPPKTVTPSVPVQHIANAPSWVGVAYMILISMIVILGILIILKRRGGMGSVSKCDLYVLNIDESNNTISLECLEKLHGDTYIKYDESEPLLVSVPKKVHRYKIKIGGKTYDDAVITYSYHGILLPLDVKLMSGISLITSTNEYAELDEDELPKLLAELHKLSDRVKGHVVIAPKYRIAFAFNIRKAIRDAIEKILYDAGETVQHLFSTMRRTSSYKEYIDSLTKYHEAKLGKWKIILTIIMVLGVIAVLIMSIPHR